MEILTIMSEKSSINQVSSICILFFFILFSLYLQFTKIECWPIFKQDPKQVLNLLKKKTWCLRIIGRTFKETTQKLK